ncbi:MAG: AAA family ATPase [Bacteroidetes bacterium]|nr:AAA family ATPase [Bacteroidota bacterium]
MKQAYIRFVKNLPDELLDSHYTFNKENLKKVVNFGPINKLNIFIGANNSGKSRMLRALAKMSNFSLVFDENFEKKFEIIASKLSAASKKLQYQKNVPSIMLNSDRKISTERHLGKEYINTSHKFLHENNFKEQIQFNSSFFESLAETINKLLSDNQLAKLVDTLVLNYHILKLTCHILKSPHERFVREFRNYGAYQMPDNLGLDEKEDLLVICGDLIEQFRICADFQEEKLERVKSLYFPVLRSANSLFNDTLSVRSDAKYKIRENVFLNTTVENYKFLNKERNGVLSQIETGLDLYDKIKNARNNYRRIREGFDAFERFLRDNFFPNSNLDIVAFDANGKDSDEHISIFIDGKDHSLHDLGDGIQSLIVLLYPIFTAEKDSWIFIEEPEINLHPGMQRILLNQLLKNEYLIKLNLTLFITTHSNHLIDLTIEQSETSIFVFEKIEAGKEKYAHLIRNMKGGDIEILDTIGAKNSSVFMANCSIWVEGITDRIYINSFLKAYIRHKEINEKGKNKFALKEDLDYCFFEYAGSNIEHYLFNYKDAKENLKSGEEEKINTQFLSNRIFLIADLDRDKSKKHDDLLRRVNSNFKYRVLAFQEIENLISPKQLEILIPQLHNKFINVKIPKFIHSEYKRKYLGDFLEQKLQKKFPKSIKAASGTLRTYYKKKLAQLVSDGIEWDTMSSEAKRLTEEIYAFISENRNK